MSWLAIIGSVKKRMRHILSQKPATVEYPYVVRQTVPGSRNGIKNNFDECIGCYKCEQACPVKCITIKSQPFSDKEKIPKTSQGILFEKKIDSFVIDFGRCVQCGFCVEVCPTSSLVFDKNFPPPRQNQRHHIVDLVHKPRSVRKEEGFED